MEELMTTPNPKAVREIAREAMELAATRRDDLDRAIQHYGNLGDRPEDRELLGAYREAYGALYRAAATEMQTATVTVSWPDEQPQDGGARARVAAFCDALDHYGDDGNPIASEHNPDGDPDTALYLTLTKQDLRAALAELERLRAERAEFADLLGWHVDAEDDPCRLDHHGYCQAHGSLTEGPCRTAASRELLARVRAESVPQQPESGGEVRG